MVKIKLFDFGTTFVATSLVFGLIFSSFAVAESPPAASTQNEEPRSDLFVEEPDLTEQFKTEEKLDKKALKLKEIEEKKAQKLKALADIPQLLGKHYFVGVGFHFATEIKFQDSEFTTSGVDTTGSTKFLSSPGADISFGIMHSQVDSFGGFASLTYQLEKKIQSVKQRSGGNVTTSTFPGSKPSIQITTFEFGTLYRFKHAYLPIGFNYSFPEYRGLISSSYKTKVTGGIGYQLGYGEILTQNLMIELLWKNIAVEAKSSGTGTELDYGAGQAAHWAVQLRYGY